MPQVTQKFLYSFGPGFSHLNIVTTAGTADTNGFIFNAAEIKYGIRASPIFPANMASPIIILSEPIGEARFAGVLTNNRLLASLAANNPENAAQTSMQVYYSVCHDSTKVLAGFVIRYFFPIEYSVTGQGQNFIFLDSLTIRFFRLETM